MFKIEECKNKEWEIEHKHIEPLDDIWFYGISAKRYVLFQREDQTQQIKIRKYSSHGLGHIQNLNEKELWKDVLKLQDNPEMKDAILSKFRTFYSTSELSITNHDIWKRFANFNDDKPLSKQIKPFNFITVGTGYQKARARRQS